MFVAAPAALIPSENPQKLTVAMIAARRMIFSMVISSLLDLKRGIYTCGCHNVRFLSGRLFLLSCTQINHHDFQSCSKFRKSRIMSPIECALSVSKKIPDVLITRMIPHYERDPVFATMIFHHA